MLSLSYVVYMLSLSYVILINASLDKTMLLHFQQTEFYITLKNFIFNNYAELTLNFVAGQGQLYV